MCLKFIKEKTKKTVAFALALMMAGMVATPAYAETTKGYFGREVKITHESKERFVSNATFYDYYSDSQVGTTKDALPITDAQKSAKSNPLSAVNTFQKFNNVLLKTMKYTDATQTPTKNPLYQGYFVLGMTNEHSGNIKKTANFDLDNHGGWWKSSAETGLVDSRLTTDSQGNSYLTTSNPNNGKSAKLPYFDKELLTSTTFDNSELTLGSVKEKVSFPFRPVEKKGVTYYEFDSSKDVVRFNENGDLVYKGTDASQQVVDVNGKPGFFPYNEASKDKKNQALNFGFGAKIEVPFCTTKDGKIGGQDIVFEFTGDDDVWVYIDGELALDMGGAHKVIDGSINLATMKSKVKRKSYNLSDAVKTKIRDTSKTHTLTLFYLERGEWQSNMKIKFNLPEANNITVANEVKTTKVNSTFLEATKKAIENEKFVIGLTDKNLNEFDEQVLTNKEYVSYTNEFKYNDTLQLKISGLKDTNRKLADLYDTTYTLSDSKEVISTKKKAQVTDGRAKTKDAFIFRNKKNTSTPFILAQYVNEVATGKLELTNSVSSIITENDEFQYSVSYCDVFGVTSEAKFYSGEYTVIDTKGTKTKKTTTDGKIVLKANEKAEIEGIPAGTRVAVQNDKMDAAYSIEAIDSTSNIEVQEDKALAQGTINKKNNEVIFALAAQGGVKPEEGVYQGGDNNSTKDKQTKETKKLDPNALDESPKTGDESLFLIAIMAAVLALATGTTLVIRKKVANK